MYTGVQNLQEPISDSGVKVFVITKQPLIVEIMHGVAKSLG
jgi:hypothetical protein